MGTHLQIRLADALAGLTCFACVLALSIHSPGIESLGALRAMAGTSLIISSVCWPFGGWRLALTAAAFSIACQLIVAALCIALVLLFFGGVVL